MLDVAHAATQLVHYVVTAVEPSPAPKSGGGGSNLAGIAAIIASITGLVSAIGAIAIGMRNKKDSGGSNPAADKAIEYLIKQNKELLKRQRPEES